jgi:hypothetical protein
MDFTTAEAGRNPCFCVFPRKRSEAMNRRKFFAVFLLVGIALTLAAQQAVAPPPKPADNGPSLAATMQFIQDKLSEQGKIAYVLFFQDINNGSTGSITYTNEISNVIADQNQCRISYHRKATQDGNTYKDENIVFSLRDVQEIVVKPGEQNQTEWDAKNGQPNIISTSTSPPIAALLVRPHAEEDFFLFTDANLADRVAKALTHAVELCGGGSKDPF